MSVALVQTTSIDLCEATQPLDLEPLDQPLQRTELLLEQRVGDIFDLRFIDLRRGESRRTYVRSVASGSDIAAVMATPSPAMQPREG
jgi:hypothetical protein